MTLKGYEPPPPVPAKWLARDRAFAQAVHHATNRRRSVLRWLVAVSWLSDGAIWYATILALPWLDGTTGTACALRMLLLGVVDLAIYKIMKRHFARPRPFVACPDVEATTRCLDEYSFPSGHVLHAMAFATVLTAYHPVLGWIVWPFVVLVAASRIGLGLHYPSDVIVGAGLGWFMATCLLVLF